MKRNLTDMFDEKTNKFDVEKNFNYGITIKKSSDGKTSVVNANALIYLGAKIEDYVSNILKEELKKTFKINKAKKILVIGLGNKDIYNDSLGPVTVDKLIVSRGLNIKPEVSVVSPNVFSNTGIETSDFIIAICKTVNPDCVILIDALATVSTSRLCCCFQISKNGLTAGSGVGSNNKKITKDLLGVKNFVTIGVPMLIYASSLVSETDSNFKDNITSFPSLILSPVDIKKNINLLSNIISNALNGCIFKNLSQDEINALIN